MAKTKNKIRATHADKVFDKLNMALMGIIGLLIVYPLYYVFVASFTDPNVVSTGTLLLYPKELYLEGYDYILNYKMIWTGYGNTILYSLVGVALFLILTIPTAYVLSRKDLFGAKKLSFFFIFTMFFRGGMIPLYLVIKNLGIYDTIWGMTLPSAILIWDLLVCRAFFSQSIPQELLEAAQIDGCSDIRFFFSIVLPLSPTIISVMTLYHATFMWNNFFDALMFLSKIDNMPLQVVLRNLVLIGQVSNISTNAEELATRAKLAEQMKYGMIVVSVIPLLCVYPFLQKHFAKGIMVGAIKG